MAIEVKEVDKVEVLTLQDNYIDIAAFDSTAIVQRAMPVKDMEIKNSILSEQFLLNMPGTKMVFKA